MTEANASTAIDYAAIGNAAAEGEDQQNMKEGGGGFDRPLPEAGKCTLRLMQYVELGSQKPTNPTYKPREAVTLRFEVNSRKHMIVLDDGTKVPNTIDVRLSKGGKTSKYGKLFSALNKSGKYNHFAQMVGTGAWLAEITHNTVGAGTDKEKTYANLGDDNGWSFDLPIFEDPTTGESKPIPVAELVGDAKMFLYENSGINDTQYKALWDTLYIEGEHETGQRKGQSKNWIQGIITDSLTFEGSRLQRIIAGDSAEGLEEIDVPASVEPAALPEGHVDANEPKTEAPAATGAVDKVVKAKAAKKTPAKTPDPEPADDDPLAALGL